MSRQLQKIIVALTVCVIALVGCSSKSESETQAPERANKLVFSDVEVDCANRDGFFGGHHAKFEVTGSVKNDTADPVNEDNMPELVVEGDGGQSFKADLSQDKLLSGETCSISYKGEIDLDSADAPKLSFMCKLDVSGLEDAQKELNSGVAKVVSDYADEDAKKDAEKKKAEEESAKAKQKREDDKKTLEACKGKTAAEAKKAAEGTDYEPRFMDSYDVDVTKSVKDGAEAGSAKVTSVEVKDEGLLSSASVTFKLDYVDPEEQKKRDEKAAEEAAKKEEAERRAAEEKARQEAEAAIPTEYKNALRKAESYSKQMHMSRQGIYDQLVAEYGEKFSPEAAQYAIDNMQADWNENALLKARSYQDLMAMSPEAIRDQLVSEYGEKFTEEEADYAIANL